MPTPLGLVTLLLAAPLACSGSGGGTKSKEPAAELFSAGLVARRMAAQFDVTLVSQTSVDRFWMIEPICERWLGPVVLSVHSPGGPRDPAMSAVPKSCQDLTVRRTSGVPMEQYPVNYLRNQALTLVTTSHFLVVDIDFWPSARLYQTVLQFEGFLADPWMALVVPAFERNGNSCSSLEKCQALSARDPAFIPRTLDELLGCAGKRKCAVFQSGNNVEGHSTTETHHWYEYSAEPGLPEPRTIPCFKSTRYEPYMIIKKEPDTPLYDERFTGYGKNKIQYIQHLRYSGFKFAILPREFLVHYPHPRSKAKLSWLHNHTLHRGTDGLYRKFLDELKNNFGTRHMKVPLCKMKASHVLRQKEKRALEEKEEKEDNEKERAPPQDSPPPPPPLATPPRSTQPQQMSFAEQVEIFTFRKGPQRGSRNSTRPGGPSTAPAAARGVTSRPTSSSSRTRSSGRSSSGYRRVPPTPPQFQNG